MNYDLAKLMQDALKKNENIFKSAQDDSLDMDRVIKTRLLGFIMPKLNNYRIVKSNPESSTMLIEFQKEVLIDGLDKQSMLADEEKGYDYEDNKVFYPEFNYDDRYFEAYGKLAEELLEAYESNSIDFESFFENEVSRLKKELNLD